MIQLSGSNRRKRIISFFLLITFVSEIITPTATFALTGGPSQPEVQAFTPINTSEMVDLTSGDFKYNIPLMDVGGYPLNIAYNSGAGMDQEASWAGLGWNLNVGAINRNMRGLPDDFNGDMIEKEFNMKDNNTFGVNVGVGVEIFGWKKTATSSSHGSGKLNVGLGLTYNNYTGIGMEHSASIGISAGNSGKGSMNAGLGMKASNSGGLTVSPSLSFSYKTDEKQKGDERTTGSVGVGIGMSMNSRSGLKDLSVNASYNKTTEKNTIYLNPNSFFGIGIKSSSQSGGMSSAGVINFGASTFIPQVHNSMVNNSVALSFKLGTTIFGLDGDITLGGYFSNQSLLNNSSSLPAYGYMFSHNGQGADNVLMDFNREKDQAFSRYTKNLPITNQTYDVFSVTGQGIGGAFRPFRSDVGYMFDNSATTTSDSYSGGVEFAATNTAHLGVNVSVVDVNTTTGKWINDNDAMANLRAHDAISGQPDYEPYYFKEVGEKSVDDVQRNLYNNLGYDLPKRIEVTGLVNHTASNNLESGSNTPLSAISSTNHITTRQKRNQVLSTLNLDEAAQYGLNKSFYSGATRLVNSAAKGHHIAEITTLRLDGSRYVYGLPAYNTDQEEVTFNASYLTTSSNNPAQNNLYDPSSGYVSYNTGDRSISNSKGLDHYYNKVKLPAYAHSYLLTAVISPDYVDLTGDGPTDDDFGNYTKFEYKKVDGMKWRMPFESLKANFNESGKSIENDDQGNFLYGEKELWFTSKIETKNYVAVFDLGDRHDAIGVNDIDGGANTSVKTKYIKSISLYSKPDFIANPPSTSPTPAIPIKVVHFVYDYSLCSGIPNNDGLSEIVNGTNINSAKGKLTLKAVYFTYGKSDKAAFSQYKFTYNQNLLSGGVLTGISNNFKYHSKAFDRWGNYMPLNNNNSSYTTSSPLPTGYSYGSALNNSEFPYTDQFSKEDADFRSSAWNLTKIDLPSGATIEVNYESDDYAFVQNRPSMQMMKVLGISNSIGSGIGTINTPGQLYNRSNPLNPTSNSYLQFELTKPLQGALPAADEIREDYLKDINSSGKYLYFRFLVNLTSTSPGHANSGDHFEYVSGYAELDGGATAICGIVSSVTGPHNFPVAYVKLKDVVIDDKTSIGSTLSTNPITKAALNFGKSHYNNIVWDAAFSPPSDVITAVKQLAGAATSGFGKAMIDAILGPNLSLIKKGYGQEFVYGKSWIRLYNPNGHKFGGGSRVKELTINDNWLLQTSNGTYAGQDNSKYGQEFTYETEFNGKMISSGVASYEPMLGGDENPFRQPVFMGPNKWTMLVPDERFFMEEPFGETFFPSASIAYSKVKVKNKIPVGTNLKTHGTGYVVHEFYTAKDYPTITRHTSIDPKQWKPPLGGLLKVMARDYVTASQGYVIKLNDMHGKPKGQSVFAEGTVTPISKVEYLYKTKGPNGYTDYGLKDIYSDASCVPNELDNRCWVIDQKGNISSTTIGMDFDAVADFRENETTTVMGGAQINLSMFLVGVFPGIVPTIWPDFSYEKTRFRSSVITKVISNYGILDKTTAQDLGSIVTTSNLAYDAQTGDVLVTRTKNDFEDDIYSVKYPSFWGYDLMGPAYKNIGFSETVNFSAGVATVGNTAFYNIGDELALGTTGSIGWICSISGGQITIIDKLGNPSMNGTSIKIKVLRSGRRNLLGSQMASLTSLVNPVDFDNNGVPDATLNVSTIHNVLNTSAIEYSDQWQTFKGYDNSIKSTCNCTLTQNAVNWRNLFNKLLINQKFLGQEPIASGCPNPPFATVYYPEWVNTSLSAGWPSGNCGPRWSTQLSPGITYTTTGIASNELYGCVNNTTGFDQWYNELEGCKVKFTLPAGNDWSLLNLSYTNGSSAPVFNFAPSVGNCANNHEVNLILVVNGVSIPVVFYSVCNTLTTGCATSGGSGNKCGVDIGDKVNPFVYGIKGSWRPKITWSFLESRRQTTPTSGNNLDIRKDGYLTNYSAFYGLTGGSWVKNATNWTYTSEISKHTPNGVEVENKDALNRYSSALYGYNESLPIAVASNAKLQEIAFDGFEDYNFNSLLCNNFSKEHHFDFYDYKTNLDNLNAHTGKYSMKVTSTMNVNISKKLSDNCPTTISPLCTYTLNCSDFIYPFSPITGNGSKKYILSYWVKEKVIGSEATNILDYTNSSVNLFIGGTGSVASSSVKKSEIIDGWQRFEQEFTISSGATGKIYFSLVNSSINNSGVSYFDDIRIHPFNSNMKSFVYDPVTLKYVAELDANNFATFYEYDEEGSLIRVKKETEKGIMTIQETKNHTKR